MSFKGLLSIIKGNIPSPSALEKKKRYSLKNQPQIKVSPPETQIDIVVEQPLRRLSSPVGPTTRRDSISSTSIIRGLDGITLTLNSNKNLQPILAQRHNSEPDGATEERSSSLANYSFPAVTKTAKKEGLPETKFPFEKMKNCPPLLEKKSSDFDDYCFPPKKNSSSSVDSKISSSFKESMNDENDDEDYKNKLLDNAPLLELFKRKFVSEAPTSQIIIRRSSWDPRASASTSSLTTNFENPSQCPDIKKSKKSQSSGTIEPVKRKLNFVHVKDPLGGLGSIKMTGEGPNTFRRSSTTNIDERRVLKDFVELINSNTAQGGACEYKERKIFLAIGVICGLQVNLKTTIKRVASEAGLYEDQKDIAQDANKWCDKNDGKSVGMLAEILKIYPFEVKHHPNIIEEVEKKLKKLAKTERDFFVSLVGFKYFLNESANQLKKDMNMIASIRLND